MISELEIVLRLTTATVLACLIGIERERLGWTAGVRTHMLVGVGSCLLMIVSAYGFEDAIRQDLVMLDPSRVAAQVVSGIGFLGAGAILMKGQMVRGLTTAASIWSVAAIGLAAGGGLFFAAVVTTALILFILIGMKPLEQAYHAKVQNCVLRVDAEPGALTLAGLKEALHIHGTQIKRLETHAADDVETTIVHLGRVSLQEIRLGSSSLSKLPGIHAVQLVKRQRGGAIIPPD